MKEKLPNTGGSSSKIVNTAVLSAPMLAPPVALGRERFTVRFAFTSATLLLMIPMVKVLLVSPSPKVTVPVVFV